MQDVEDGEDSTSPSATRFRVLRAVMIQVQNSEDLRRKYKSDEYLALYSR